MNIVLCKRIMLGMSGFLFAGILLLLLVVYLKTGKKSKAKLPAGPPGIPVFGNILQIVKTPHLQFTQWAKQYGSVYAINLMGSPALVVNDVKTMKELFGSMASTGKFSTEVFEIFYEGKNGLVYAEGQVWQELQKFCMKTLKHLGFGSGAKLDPVILRECDSLCQWLNQKLDGNKSGKEISFSTIIMQATSNTLWNMVTGERLNSSESYMVHLLEIWCEAFNLVTKTGLVFIPWLKYIAPEKSGYNLYFKACKDIRDYIRKYFEQHEQSLPATNQQPTDLIHAFMEQTRNCHDPNSAFYGEGGLKQSFMLVVSVLAAGSETTATSVNWLIFYLVGHPNVQKKLQEEIDNVIGTEGDPSLNDRQKLPYLDAVIMEMLRITSIAPFGVFHELLEEVKFRGYKLPKGLILIANIYHANFDPSVWGDPETFRPERFLEGDETQKKILRENVASFQKGKRSCPGEQLAKDVQFMFLAKLLQNYTFEPANGISRERYLEPQLGFLLVPQKYNVLVKRRR